MLGKTEKNPQLNITEIPLIHFLDPHHELCELARKTAWERVERDFAVYYSTKGAPSVPIRVMVGLILLKQVYRFGDRSALAQWLENPYWQFFCGEVTMQHKPPFHHGDFSHFRKRIGREGEQKLNELGVAVFGPSFTAGVSKRKDHSGRPQGIPERVLNRIGNYLLKISSR